MFYRDRNKMRQILNMHIIKDRLNVEKIRQKNANLVGICASLNRD